MELGSEDRGLDPGRLDLQESVSLSLLSVVRWEPCLPYLSHRGSGGWPWWGWGGNNKVGDITPRLAVHIFPSRAGHRDEARPFSSP